MGLFKLWADMIKENRDHSGLASISSDYIYDEVGFPILKNGVFVFEDEMNGSKPSNYRYEKFETPILRPLVIHSDKKDVCFNEEREVLTIHTHKFDSSVTGKRVFVSVSRARRSPFSYRRYNSSVTGKRVFVSVSRARRSEMLDRSYNVSRRANTDSNFHESKKEFDKLKDKSN